jgi:hypothetical protein
MTVTLATYGDLKSDVQRWLDRDDDTTVAEIPNFILYAHTELVRELRLPLVQTAATLTLNAERVNLPADFQAVRALNIQDSFGLPLNAVSAEQRASDAALWPAGRPVEYAIEASKLALAPVPDGSYTATFIYSALPSTMSADGDTNAVFAKNPFLYLWGALAAGFAFNQFTELAALYDAKFRDAIAQFKRQGLADAMSGPVQVQSSVGFTP